MTGLPPAYEIRTTRLLLRCKQPGDGPMLKYAVDMSLDHLRPWMPWAKYEPSELSATEDRIARFQREFLTGENRKYGIFNSAATEILGGAELHETHVSGTLELGYWLRADCTGQGLATEAAAALARAGIIDLGAPRIEIRCDPKNLRSCRIPERLGFRLEEIRIAEAVNPAGEPRDTMVWVMTAAEFNASDQFGSLGTRTPTGRASETSDQE